MAKTPQPNFDKSVSKQTIDNSEDDKIAKALDLDPIQDFLPAEKKEVEVIHKDDKMENLENDYKYARENLSLIHI